MLDKTSYDKLIDDLGQALLVAVSKRQELTKLQQLYDYGHRDYGENRVQALIERYDALPSDIRWHLIGQLQRNKVKYIAEWIHLIHSVDSWRLLLEVDKQAARCNRVIDFLFQIKISHEDTKSGYDLSQLRADLAEHDLSQLTHVRCRGLMGMASFTQDVEVIRSEYQGLIDTMQELREGALSACHTCTELSMGMSGDYPIAVEMGSTLVRIGSGVFGQRSY